MDGNGADDVIIGQPFDLGLVKGVVSVRNGPSGHLIWQVQGLQNGTRFGYAVAGRGDANGDGVTDVLVGEPGGSSGGPTFVGKVHVYSGATGTQLFEVSGPGEFGSTVAWAGDVDEDGHDELLVGAPRTLVGGVEVGRVALFSGLDGELLLELFGSVAVQHLGRAVAGGQDLTGDGKPDFAVLAGNIGSQNDVVVCDAATGAVENVLPYGDTTIAGARGLDVLSDVSGDGLADLVASSPDVGDPDGTVIVFHNLDRGPPPVLSVTGAAMPGAPLTIAVEGLLPATQVFLVVGATLQQFPFKGGVLVPNPDLLVPLTADGEGHVALPAVWPAGLPQWTTVWLQGWAADDDATLGWISTDGLGLTQTTP
jgi:hypothetical protein